MLIIVYFSNIHLNGNLLFADDLNFKKIIEEFAKNNPSSCEYDENDFRIDNIVIKSETFLISKNTNWEDVYPHFFVSAFMTTVYSLVLSYYNV